MRPLFTVALTVPLLPLHLTAVESDEPVVETTPTVVVTARRSPSQLDRDTQTIEIIERDDLDRLGGVTRPLEALQRQPGIYATGDLGSGIGGNPTLQIRGTDSAQNQLLVDGIPLHEAVFGTYTPVALPQSAVDRIEVLKGAQPLYGTKAVGGVINILSARPTDRMVHEARIEAGSFGTVYGEVGSSGPIGDNWGYAIRVGGFYTDGISSTSHAGLPYDPAVMDEDLSQAPFGDPLDYEEDLYRRIDVTGRVVYEADWGSLYVGLLAVDSYNESDADTRFGGSGAVQPDDRQSSGALQTWRLSTGGEAAIAPDWRVYGDAAITRSSSERNDSGDENETDDLYVSARAVYDGLEQWRFMLGVDDLHQSGSFHTFDTSFMPVVVDESQNLLGVHAQAAWSDQHWDLDATIRYEQHSEEGDAFTWRLGAAWYPCDASRLHAAIATGFQAPTLFQLYDPGLGNPDLEPAESLSLEIGHDTSLTESVTLTNTLFRIDQTDYIAFDFVRGFVNEEGDSFSQGIETSLTAHPIDLPLELRVVHTLLDAENEAGERPFFRAKNVVGVSATWQIQSWDAWWSTTLDFVEGYDTFTGPVPDRTLVGLAAGWEPRQDLTVYGRVTNLFDTAYTTNHGYTGEPAQVTVGLRATF